MTWQILWVGAIAIGFLLLGEPKGTLLIVGVVGALWAIENC